MVSFQEWLDAAKKLAIFHEAKIACPECREGHLKVFDIAVDQNISAYERVLFCAKCGSHNSMRMTDSKRYLGEPSKS